MVKTPETGRSFFPFRRYSIQKRLPLLICLLLLIVIVTFGWISYSAVKKASIETGKLRLRSLSGQLGPMFAQSAQTAITATRTAAAQEALKKCLQSAGKDSVPEVLTVLQKLQKDSTWFLVQLVNDRFETVLHTGKAGDHTAIPARSALSFSPIKPDSGRIGKIYLSGDSMYYPIMASVTESKKITGYIIRWQLMKASPTAIQLFSQLMGAGVTLYIGNADGSLWSNLVKPVSYIPEQAHRSHDFIEYSKPESGKMFATAARVGNTPWLILLEQSQETLTGPAKQFLQVLLLTGCTILIIGIFLTWLISRSITGPLKRLTSAAAAIAGGDYSHQVAIKRKDETGQLAEAFNKMAEEVRFSQKGLEVKVLQRTAQLEAANKELEAFSYSVSHDLRAPLRAISGYAMILKEDNMSQLDPEANRVIDVIISNARMMGQLIDDLIAFAKIGKNSSALRVVDMKKMADACVTELLQNQPGSHYQVELGDLPDCYADGKLIKQVWLNLIGNAIKYSSNVPQPHIEIGYKKEAGHYIYYVRDNGAGFDMKYIEKLFGVFQRLHSNEEFEGTGIGLALAKRIVNNFGGEIWAEGAVGKGATFYFSLPVRKHEWQPVSESR
jgi:signal transduction histidine kinase